MGAFISIIGVILMGKMFIYRVISVDRVHVAVCDGTISAEEEGFGAKAASQL